MASTRKEKGLGKRDDCDIFASSEKAFYVKLSCMLLILVVNKCFNHHSVNLDFVFTFNGELKKSKLYPCMSFI